MQPFCRPNASTSCAAWCRRKVDFDQPGTGAI